MLGGPLPRSPGALVGANAYMNTAGSVADKTAAARSAAIAATTCNGYTDSTAQSVVSVNVHLLSNGAEVQVGITYPHANTFARIVPGQASRDVSVTAAAIAGAIDTAVGAAPWIMNIDAFNPNGSPKYDADDPQSFGEINGDYPVDGLDLAWTDYLGSECQHQRGGRHRPRHQRGHRHDAVRPVHRPAQRGQPHGPLPGVDSYLAGTDVPVPIVGPRPPPDQANEGGFKGWATIGECTPAQQAAGQCGVIDVSAFRAYMVRLWT